MRRAEIVRKFDRIVEFSGIEHMLDTPVKRYSSGMYVRLGFSVAAHLEPDILVLDEVLAVGDAPFQGRCLELVRRLSQGGTTVLLVSHNLGTVASFCRSGLLLEEGRLAAQGPRRGRGADVRALARDRRRPAARPRSAATALARAASALRPRTWSRAWSIRGPRSRRASPRRSFLK